MNPSPRSSLFLLLLWTALIGVASAATSGGIASGSPATKHWTADNGNGTYSNPLFYEEFEDPDVIRVGDEYFLAGTTMHMMPSVQLMRSKDLVNWELAGYCGDRLDLGPTYRLEGGNIYGKGIWAPCLRYHNGMFYVFTNVNGAGLMVYRSKSITGPWERNQLPGRHDLSVLFDDDGKIYIISGNTAPYPIEELAPDLRSFVPNSRRQLVVPPGQRMGEGHHLYKVNGKYVDISAIPGGAVNQMVAVADSIDGPWRVTTMVDGESLGVPSGTPASAQPNNPGLWLHQGGMVDTPSGEWWSIIMSDHGSAGRMVSLVPITWDDGFPLIGLPGNLRKAPNTWVKPNTGVQQEPMSAFVHDDNFNSSKLSLEWQWNHVPDDTKWSLTEKPGALRLHSLPAANFYTARNSLAQRPPAPESTMTVELDTSGLALGDVAGLGLICTPYAGVAVVKTAEGVSLQMFQGAAGGNRGGGGRGGRGGARGAPAAGAPAAAPAAPAEAQPAPPVAATAPPAIAAVGTPVANPPARVWLRVHCNFDTDRAEFSWSADGKTFTQVGTTWTIPAFQLMTFQGVRPSLFNFNTSGQPGGFADFDNYTVEEPRARGIEREIPVGKTVVFTSGADGGLLIDLNLSSSNINPNSALMNTGTASDSPLPLGSKFQVVDLGLGRVALKGLLDRFLSVDGDTVRFKRLDTGQPGPAETFQWVNLMRGDMMLMSLTNHRYLATTPGTRSPVTATALGASPARKSGAEFKWKTAD
jgi:xylan 1,4-beta-xylosidase